jgi:pentapeptide repeat protein
VQLDGANLFRARLQGALLEGAELQGAELGDAQLQGALLDRAQLQGTSLNGAHLQSASLRGTFVWRIDARTADTTDARINGIESGPKDRSYSGVWSAGSFRSLRRLLRNEVGDLLREAALGRIEILNPEMPLPGEEQMAEYWGKLQSLSPAPASYEEKLAEQWRLIGCSADGASYVLAGLIRTMDYYSPFSPDSAQVPQLAADFLKDDCAGARGLSDKARAKFKALRDRAAQGAINPSSQMQ